MLRRCIAQRRPGVSMNARVSSGLPRLLPLTACLAATFAFTDSHGRAAESGSISTGNSTASPRSPQAVVTNCEDSGPGSLRQTILDAVEGDTIDLTHLTCSTITLTSGPIQIFQNDLIIEGPGATLLAVNGDNVQQVMQHLGDGTLTISAITLSQGYLSDRSDAGGGCLYVRSSLVVSDSVISYCGVYDTISAYGGAIFALNDVTIQNSVITSNTVRAPHVASGGGLQVLGNLFVGYSTISGNRVITADGAYEFGGAAHTFADVTIAHSTINANSGKRIGGLFFETFGTTNVATIVDSTVSGNASTDGGPIGGIYTTVPLGIYNSTIAFNTGATAGGVYAKQVPLTLQSTIIAENTTTDLTLAGAGASVDGANNLIEIADDVPANTIRDNPQLAPLHFNGGRTPTHKLLDASPAIGAGNDVFALDTDQRGAGFARTSGAAPDIGVYETQVAPDTIFANGFDR
jgi:hypothetical protein